MGIAPRPMPFRNRTTVIRQVNVPRATALRNGSKGPRVKVDPRTLLPKARSFLTISLRDTPYSALPRTSETVMEAVAQELIVAMMKDLQEKLGKAQSKTGKDTLCAKDKLDLSCGRPGGAKSEKQMIEAKGTAGNYTGDLSDGDLKEELQDYLAAPRDAKGHIIFFDKKENYFYIHEGAQEKRVDVYVEMRPNPTGQCTVDFPTGMIPVLITIAQAALKAR